MCNLFIICNTNNIMMHNSSREAEEEEEGYPLRSCLSMGDPSFHRHRLPHSTFTSSSSSSNIIIFCISPHPRSNNNKRCRQEVPLHRL